MSYGYRSCIVALIVFASAGVASAQGDIELSIFAGYRDGGEVRVFATNETFNFDGSETFGIHFDYEVGIGDSFVEFLWSRQQTQVQGNVASNQFDVDIDYFHLGLMSNLNDDDRVLPYAGGGLGVTYFDPKERGLSSDARFSFSGAAGVRFRFGDHVGIRLEARLFGTFVNSSSALWCSGGSGGGGCSFGFSGDVLWQYEGTAGVSVFF